MQVSGLRIAAIGLLMAMCPIQVRSASADDDRPCNQVLVQVLSEEKIAACTREINSGLLQGTDLATAYLNRGIAYARAPDIDRAFADYGEAIRLDPKNTTAYTGRGGLYLRKGDADHAIADYSEVIQIDPGLAFGFYNRGNAYAVMSDFDRAISDLNEAIRLDPQF